MSIETSSSQRASAVWMISGRH